MLILLSLREADIPAAILAQVETGLSVLATKQRNGLKNLDRSDWKTWQPRKCSWSMVLANRFAFCMFSGAMCAPGTMLQVIGDDKVHCSPDNDNYNGRVLPQRIIMRPQQQFIKKDAQKMRWMFCNNWRCYGPYIEEHIDQDHYAQQAYDNLCPSHG